MVDELVNTTVNARRIASVEACFGLTGQPLSVPGRVLIGEGRLAKMCRKKLKRRQFFLFNDLLVYGNIIIENKKYNKQHIIPLECIKLESLDDDHIDESRRHGWLVCTPRKSFAVYAATAEEKRAWMGHMKRCINELITKSGKKPHNQHAAVWVPDAEAHVCMVCRKAHFNIVNRRHHCRKCGSVVCNACSSRTMRLPMQSKKPQRVCDLCFDASKTPTARIEQTASTVNSVGLEDNRNKDDDDDDTADKTSDSSDSDDDDDEDEVSLDTTTKNGRSQAYDDNELISPLSQLGPLPRSSEKKPSQQSNL